MHLFNVGFVKLGTGVGFRSTLLFGAVDDGQVTMGQELVGMQSGVAPLDEKVFNVVLDGEATGTAATIPLKVNARKVCALPVHGEVIVILEDVTEVVGMLLAYVLDAEVVDNEAE